MKKVKKILSQKGFSLVEIMVAVAIIGILAAIAVPSYHKYQRKAKQVEPKLIMGGIYTSNIAFNAEWGYSTSNFIQLGFSPSGDIRYKTGFDNTTLASTDPGSWVSGTPLPTTLSDYDGPPVPDTASKKRVDTENFCKNSGDCTYLPRTSLTIPSSAVIDNSKKFSPKFIIIGVGDLGGVQEDHWEMGVGQSSPKPAGKYIMNIKNGL